MYRSESDFNSRYHFLRMMGRHRNLINNRILSELNEDGSIEWLDNLLSPLSDDGDLPFVGINFVKSFGIDNNDFKELQSDYVKEYSFLRLKSSFDAVGKTTSGQIICVKALSYSDEVISKKVESMYLSGQNKLFQVVADALRLGINDNWSDYYGNYMNDLFTIIFLNSHGIKAKYLTLCIVPTTAKFEASVEFLEDAIQKREKLVGLYENKWIALNTAVCYISTKGEYLDNNKIKQDY